MAGQKRKSYRSKNRQKNINNTESQRFKSVNIQVPVDLWSRLETFAKQRGRPKARLLAYAIFNEFETEKPFNFEEGPPANYTPDYYALAGERLLLILKKEMYGLPKDILILCAEGMGFTTTDMRGAIQYLIETRKVSLVHQAISYYDYPLDYLWLVAPQHVARAIEDLHNPKPLGRPPKHGILDEIV